MNYKPRQQQGEEVAVRFCDMTIYVVVTYFCSGAPAKVTGPPEDCYPAEPYEIEFEISEQDPHYEFLQAILDNSEYFHKVLDTRLLEHYED